MDPDELHTGTEKQRAPTMYGRDETNIRNLWMAIKKFEISKRNQRAQSSKRIGSRIARCVSGIPNRTIWAKMANK
jgi:hypothetical protein